MKYTEQQEKLIEEHLAKLIEHFDSVQILASFTDDEGTKSFSFGRGDWYARQGLAHEFIAHDQAKDTAKFLSEAIKKEDE